MTTTANARHLGQAARLLGAVLAAIAVSSWLAGPSAVLANDQAHQKIAEAALRETRDIISRDLFGHYDAGELAVLTVEDLHGRLTAERDYGLMRVTLRFSATRNATRSPSLSPQVFEAGGPCEGWLYLHCGVPIGHVFEGKLELLLAHDREGTWRAVSPHWRSRIPYSLEGYLLLEGRDKEGYVLFPKKP
jgi:hypothetical protein